MDGPTFDRASSRHALSLPYVDGCTKTSLRSPKLVPIAVWAAVRVAAWGWYFAEAETGKSEGSHTCMWLSHAPEGTKYLGLLVVDIVALQDNCEVSCSDMGISKFERKIGMWRSNQFDQEHAHPFISADALYGGYTSVRRYTT